MLSVARTAVSTLAVETPAVEIPVGFMGILMIVLFVVLLVWLVRLARAGAAIVAIGACGLGAVLFGILMIVSWADFFTGGRIGGALLGYLLSLLEMIFGVPGLK